MCFIYHVISVTAQIINIGMKSHPFIELVVSQPLDKNTAMSWKDTVVSAGPRGVACSAEIPSKVGLRVSGFYRELTAGKVHYVIPLTRDLENNECAAIAHAWDKAFAKGDFVINTSSRSKMVTKLTHLQQSKLVGIATTAAKQHHSKWYEEQSASGWGYGPRYNPSTHHHPCMLPWDQLGPQVQAERIKKFTDLMQILDQMKLKIVAR